MQSALDVLRRSLPMGLLALVLSAPLLSGSLGGWRYAPMLVGVAGIVLLGVLRSDSGEHADTRRQSVLFGVPALALVLWAALMAWNSAGSPLRDALKLSELFRLGCGLVTMVAVSRVFRSMSGVWSLSRALLIGEVVAGVAGAATYVATSGDAVGGFGNHQLLAAYLVALLPVAAVLSLRGPTGKPRALATVALVFGLGALVLTQNRISWIAAITAAVVMGLIALTDEEVREGVVRRRVWVGPALIGLLLCGVFTVMSGATESASRRIGALAGVVRGASVDPSINNRLDLLKVAESMIRERPWTGHGPGSFQMEAGRFDPQFKRASYYERVGFATMATLAHNEYAQVAAELGLVGLGLYSLVLGAALFSLGRRLKSAETDGGWWLVVGVIGSLVAVCVDGLANPAWRFPQVSLVLWTLLGFAWVLARTPFTLEPVAPTAAPAPSRRRLIVATALAVGVTSIAAAGVFPVASAGGYTVEGKIDVSVSFFSFPRRPPRPRSQATRSLVQVSRFTLTNLGQTTVSVRLVMTGSEAFRLPVGREIRYNLRAGASRVQQVRFLETLFPGKQTGGLEIYFNDSLQFTIPISVEEAPAG